MQEILKMVIRKLYSSLDYEYVVQNTQAQVSFKSQNSYSIREENAVELTKVLYISNGE